eukprot:scaffold779_cov205-Alexandrium_tamarense.AAC.23
MNGTNVFVLLVYEQLPTVQYSFTITKCNSDLQTERRTLSNAISKTEQLSLAITGSCSKFPSKFDSIELSKWIAFAATKHQHVFFAIGSTQFSSKVRLLHVAASVFVCLLV